MARAFAPSVSAKGRNDAENDKKQMDAGAGFIAERRLVGRWDCRSALSRRKSRLRWRLPFAKMKTISPPGLGNSGLLDKQNRDSKEIKK